MKTILYNKDTHQIKYHKAEGYYTVEGVRPEIPEPWVELEFVQLEPPLYDRLDYKLSKTEPEVDLANNQYILDWELTAYTQYEKDIRDWKYEEFPIKFWIDGSVLFTTMGNSFRNYLTDKGYPVEIQEDDSYLVWVPAVNETHAPYVQALKDATPPLLIEYSRPIEN